MRRRPAVFWLALGLWLTGSDALSLAQDASPPPDIPGLTQRAEAGDPEAMIALGEAYLDGTGVKRDLDMAIRLFTPGAQANDANALYLLSFTKEASLAISTRPCSTPSRR
jgi:TPR repeat protein